MDSKWVRGARRQGIVAVGAIFVTSRNILSPPPRIFDPVECMGNGVSHGKGGGGEWRERLDRLPLSPGEAVFPELSLPLHCLSGPGRGGGSNQGVVFLVPYCSAISLPSSHSNTNHQGLSPPSSSSNCMRDWRGRLPPKGAGEERPWD